MYSQNRGTFVVGVGHKVGYYNVTGIGNTLLNSQAGAIVIHIIIILSWL